jgi:hypothetical protein
VIDPAFVIALLVGARAGGAGMPLARFPGIALLAEGVACRPGPQITRSTSPASLGMLIESVLVDFSPRASSVPSIWGGAMLWPAVALHAAVAALLACARLGERCAAAGSG